MSIDILSFIEDTDLREIAGKANLDQWEWGASHPLVAALMMEGAAAYLSELKNECQAYIEAAPDNGPNRTLIVSIYGNVEDGEPICRLSFKSMFDYMLESCLSDGSYSDKMAAISEEMKKMASEIDAAVKIGAERRNEQEGSP